MGLKIEKRRLFIKIILLLGGLFFLLSSLGYINFINASFFGNFLGITQTSFQSNTFYAISLLLIGLFFVAIYFMVGVLSFLTKNNFPRFNDFLSNLISFISKRGRDLRRNSPLILSSFLLAFVFRFTFIWFGLFECTFEKTSGSVTEICGSTEQMLFLVLSLICFIYALVPSNFLRMSK